MKKHLRTSGISCLAVTLFSSAACLPVCLADEAPAAESNANVTLIAPEEASQGKLTAARVTYEGGSIAAEGKPDEPVRYESGGVTVTAQKVLLDTIAQTISATGSVVVTRELDQRRQRLAARRLHESYTREKQTETLKGDHFFYDYGKQQGTLDDVDIRLTNFTVSATKLVVNGERYTAENVVIRPGGLTEEERKIYGTPPLSLRAKSLTIDNGKLAPGSAAADKAQDANSSHQISLSAQNAGLYFKNTKIMPVPDYVLRHTALMGNRDKSAFTISPRISTGSADGLLLTTQLQYAFNRQNPDALLAVADIGISLRQGFRGGLGLNTHTKVGEFNVNAHINDIVSNQIDDRVRLNRLPEINYQSPGIKLFNLPGDRKAGVILGASWGKYREISIDNGDEVRSGRSQLYAKFTTRLANPRGPYVELFARHAAYSNFDQNYSTLGFEVGYYDNITRYIDGQFSYSHTKVSGATPFVFDDVEIRREIRTTFDLLLTPRYIIPVDLRYDLDEGQLREKSIGILRNYKTFAYGLVYSAAHNQLSLEFRQGF